LHDYLTKFFERGWPAFHSMVLAIMDYLQDEILASPDMPATINAIKTMKEHRNSFVLDRKGKQNKSKTKKIGEKLEFRFESEFILLHFIITLNNSRE